MGWGSTMGGVMSERVWATARLPASDQFAFWRDVVWQAFVPVALRAHQPGGFVSSVRAAGVGPLQIALIDSQPQSVARTEQLVKRAPGQVYFLNLPLTGGSRVRQDGRAAVLAPGDFALLDARRPFQLEFDRPFQQLSVSVPLDLLAPMFNDPLQPTALCVPGHTGIGAVASAAIRSLSTAHQALGRREASALAAMLVSLVALAIGGVSEPVRPANRLILRQAALGAIDRRLGEPDLCPAVIAASIGVSTRYLHQMFAEMGTSVSRHVLGRRLERCFEDLSDPRFDGWTVAEVAARHGMPDPSYFSRAFKARYDLTPRQLRRERRLRSATEGPTELGGRGE